MLNFIGHKPVAGLAAETVTAGSYIVDLGRIDLGLRVYHCVEPQFKDEVDSEIYDDQII